MSEQKIKFKIVTPERTVFDQEVDQATLPVSDGEVTILANHRPYIASLKPGEITLKTKKQDDDKADEPEQINDIKLRPGKGSLEYRDHVIPKLHHTPERDCR